MSTLDRYVARQYLINVASLLLILFAFVVAIDVSLKFDEFWEIAGHRARGGAAGPDAESVSFLRRCVIAVLLVFDIWLPRLVQLYNYMIGVVLVGAMGFTLTQMVRYRELVAVVAGGISLFRLARPIVLVALLFTAVQAINYEVILPRVADLLTRDHGQAAERRLGSRPVKLVPDGQRRLFHARAFDADKGVLEGLTIIERDENGLSPRTITAERAVWERADAAAGKPGAWRLEKGLSHPRNDRAGQPVPTELVVTDLDPTALKIAEFSGYSQNLSWAQIGQMLDRPELLSQKDAAGDAGATALSRADELERIRWGRLSVMACNVLALLIALPFYLRRDPTNMVVQSLKAAPLAIGASMGGLIGATASVPGLPPQVSVFVPVLVLLPVAIAGVTSVRS